MATLSQSIINTILADVNAIIADLQQLVSSYRLLVGAAEEIHRTPEVPHDILVRSVERFDRVGTLIDIIVELLCCKIAVMQLTPPTTPQNKSYNWSCYAAL